MVVAVLAAARPEMKSPGYVNAPDQSGLDGACAG
jgi:hypothetical protein